MPGQGTHARKSKCTRENRGACPPGRKRRRSWPRATPSRFSRAFRGGDCLLELKYAEDDYLPKVAFVADKYDVSRRSLQRAPSKARKLGLIDHVSRFSQKLGYREGWILSPRFERSLEKLAEKVAAFKKRPEDTRREQKDWGALDYV